MQPRHIAQLLFFLAARLRFNREQHRTTHQDAIGVVKARVQRIDDREALRVDVAVHAAVNQPSRLQPHGAAASRTEDRQAVAHFQEDQEVALVLRNEDEFYTETRPAPKPATTVATKQGVWPGPDTQPKP